MKVRIHCSICQGGGQLRIKNVDGSYRYLQCLKCEGSGEHETSELMAKMTLELEERELWALWEMERMR